MQNKEREQVNIRQKEFYDFKKKNFATKIWSHFRNGILNKTKKKIGVEKQILDLHVFWFGDLKNKKVLEKTFDFSSKLDHSYLPVQGPPGSGKSYTGSHLIVRLAKQGKKIGITALSHKVITNLLNKVWEAAQEEDFQTVYEQVFLSKKGSLHTDESKNSSQRS